MIDSLTSSETLVSTEFVSTHTLNLHLFTYHSHHTRSSWHALVMVSIMIHLREASFTLSFQVDVIIFAQCVMNAVAIWILAAQWCEFFTQWKDVPVSDDFEDCWKLASIKVYCAPPRLVNPFEFSVSLILLTQLLINNKCYAYQI